MRNEAEQAEIIASDSKTGRAAFWWNMAASTLYAFQSVILLMVLTRTVGLVYAGVFTLAYANGNLFLTIGKYGMRNYQVSDVTGQYSFGEYLTSRWASVLAMMAVSVCYVACVAHAREYSPEKSWIILWMCAFKAVDAVEDVYHGEYQRQGRLDVAARIMTLRLAVTVVCFALLVIVSGDLLLTLIVSTCLTAAVLYVSLRYCRRYFRLDRTADREKIWTLLIDCLPLAAGGFLSFYIGNAPKYAIDAVLNDELQACYGFISMPVFIIGVLNGFIFTPMLYRMSVMWAEQDRKAFLGRTYVLSAVVAVITVVCLAGAWLLGIPALSLLYDTDLSAYKAELLVLLCGGGFLGLSGLLSALITIMREQKGILISYLLVSAGALFFSGPVVEQYEMAGAAWLYLLLMGVLCLFFGVLYLYAFKKHAGPGTGREDAGGP